jgi:hypothetical protein
MLRTVLLRFSIVSIAFNIDACLLEPMVSMCNVCNVCMATYAHALPLTPRTAPDNTRFFLLQLALKLALALA